MNSFDWYFSLMSEFKEVQANSLSISISVGRPVITELCIHTFDFFQEENLQKSNFTVLQV